MDTDTEVDVSSESEEFEPIEESFIPDDCD